LEFAAGLVLGCLLGVAATLGILLFVASLPREDTHSASRLSFSGLAIAVSAMLAIAWAAHQMKLRDGSLALLLLLIILVTSRLRGLRTALVASAFAALILTIVFPPLWSLRVTQPRDQLLLLLFIISCALGSHLASGNSEPETRGANPRAGREVRAA